jgi:hypothetical protein
MTVVMAAACARERPPSAPALPAAVSTTPTPAPTPEAVGAGSPTDGLLTGWLEVKGNRVRLPDGRPFHGRGANVHDTRSCDACAWEPPRVDEVLRRVDALTDEWHATFLRLLLESYPDDGSAKNGGHGRRHFQNVLEDEQYFHDVMRIIGHVGKKRGVYVLVSIWQDPTLSPLGWPTRRTAEVWKKLAGALRDMPFVLFGLVNEPQANEDGRRDADVWEAMNDTVLAIRGVERRGRHHVITVQGTREWGRSLDYYVEHPITAAGGVNIAYETHVYDRASRFEELVARPARRLPVIVGELGPQKDAHVTMLPSDCEALFDLAERIDVPWIAWTFHNNCPPNLLVDRANTCAAGAPLEPSAWGRMVKARLARPW